MTACAPARLKDVDTTATRAGMFTSGESEMRVMSQGDRLRLQVSFSKSEICEGEFNFTQPVNGYYAVFFTQYAILIYDGKWNSPESPACKKLLGDTPEKATRVVVSDGSSRYVTVCTGPWPSATANCKYERQYFFRE
jgi:hypothetical protein